MIIFSCTHSNTFVNKISGSWSALHGLLFTSCGHHTVLYVRTFPLTLKRRICWKKTDEKIKTGRSILTTIYANLVTIMFEEKKIRFRWRLTCGHHTVLYVRTFPLTLKRRICWKKTDEKIKTGRSILTTIYANLVTIMFEEEKIRFRWRLTANNFWQQTTAPHFCMALNWKRS